MLKKYATVNEKIFITNTKKISFKNYIFAKLFLVVINPNQ